VRFGWERYADDVVSIDRFGASAPGEVVMRELGITPEHTVERALALLDAVGPGGS
jgi:transketolase